MIIKAVIWDMDGTIADSAALHFRAWQATMRRYGVDYPYQLFIASFGRNNAEILADFGYSSTEIEAFAKAGVLK